MNPKKILVIGSSNTDMTVISEKLPAPGETVLGGRFIMGAGGKGANQAVAAKRLGADVSFVCKLGNDLFGENAIAQYKKEGLEVSGIMRCETPSGVALINVDKNAENCIVVACGANGEVTEADIDAIADRIRSADILLMQLEIPVPAVLRAAKTAHEAGVFVVLNPAPAAVLPAEIYRYLSLIIPNETEMRLLSGSDDVEQAFKILFGRGIKNIIMTCGSKGCVVAENADWENRYTVPARKVNAIDTTAAGDTFCGGLCEALAEGKSLAEAVEFATLASSLTVQKVGAQDSIPTRSDIDGCS